jgi:hypothetical protein
MEQPKQKSNALTNEAKQYRPTRIDNLMPTMLSGSR